MKNCVKILAILSVFLSFYGCFAIQKGDQYKHIAPGIWRGLFLFGEDSLADKVPVNFEVITDGEKISIEFINGNSRVKSDSLRFWGDTLYAWFDNNKKYLRVIYEPGLVEGYFYDSEKKNYPIEFYAQYAQKHRFLDLRKKPKFDINGVWAMDILDETENIIPTKLDIKVDKNRVIAMMKMEKDSLPTELEGTVQDDKLFLSAFTGDRIILVKAILKDKETLGQGSIRINTIELACAAKKVTLDSNKKAE
jgi:hypothetical protein